MLGLIYYVKMLGEEEGRRGNKNSVKWLGESQSKYQWSINRRKKRMRNWIIGGGDGSTDKPYEITKNIKKKSFENF